LLFKLHRRGLAAHARRAGRLDWWPCGPAARWRVRRRGPAAQGGLEGGLEDGLPEPRRVGGFGVEHGQRVGTGGERSGDAAQDFGSRRSINDRARSSGWKAASLMIEF